MNLYLISQTLNDDYDTYDSAVVAAASEEDARRIHPNGLDIYARNPLTQRYDLPWWKGEEKYSTWCPHLEDVEVQFIGITDKYDKPAIICASFNAG